MATAAILGTAGYTGQETLDRVLAHPSLELVALGSDSLAGEPASALDHRLNGSLAPFRTNAEAAASGADVLFLCLENAQAAAFQPPADAIVVDLSGVHRLTDPDLALAWYGVAPGAWSYGLPELYPAEGRLIANPGCYATAALLALGPLAAGSRPRSSTASRASRGRAARSSPPRTPAPCSRTCRRTGSAPIATPPRSPSSSGRPVAFAPHLLPVRRGLIATCFVQTDADVRGAPRGGLRRQPPRARAARRRRARACTRAEHRLGRDRRLHRRRDRGGDRDLRPRQPRQGRRRAGGAERQPRARARRDGGAAAAPGDGVLDHERDCGEGLRGVRCRRRDPLLAARRGRRPLDGAGGRRCDVHAQQGSGRLPAGEPCASRGRRPAGRRDQLRRRERRDRRAGPRERGRDRRARRRGSSGSRPSRCSSSRQG